MQAQLQLRKAACSFQPAEGPSPGDVPGESNGRGRGRGRGRGSKPKSAKTETDGHGGHEKSEQESEADLEKEDMEIEQELAKDDITPKKKPRKRKVAPGGGKEKQDQEAVTPRRRPKRTPRKRTSPKLKKAIAAAKDGQVLDFWLQPVYIGRIGIIVHIDMYVLRIGYMINIWTMPSVSAYDLFIFLLYDG